MPSPGLTELPPWTSAPKPQAPAPGTIPSLSSRRPLDVLVVEDEPGDARLLCRMFTAISDARRSFVVTVVATLADAKTHFSDGNRADVIMLDLGLPDSNGIETVLRLHRTVPDVAIVVMTGHDDPDLSERAVECGAQDYLSKGLENEAILARVVRHAVVRMASEIERRNLIVQLTHERTVIERDLAEARRLQFSLLPRGDRVDGLLRASGFAVEACFEPSTAIGGDLWGCTDLGGGRLALYAFDFVGHGVSAALNVFRLHAMLGERRDCASDPRRMLNALDVALRRVLPRGQYATMFYGVLDGVSGRLSWANAGYPYPVHLTAEGASIITSGRGIPLGLTGQGEYEIQHAVLIHGDGLLLYSDAITEASDSRSGEPLGNKGLLDLCGRMGRPGEWGLTAFIEGLRQRTGSPMSDDLTAILVARA